MKILSIISYIVGFILLIISCFTTAVATTWWIGGIALVFLILGCVFQFNSTKNRSFINHRR